MGNLRARGANTWQLRVHTGGGRYRTRTFKGGKRDALKALARFEAAVH